MYYNNLEPHMMLCLHIAYNSVVTMYVSTILAYGEIEVIMCSISETKWSLWRQKITEKKDSDCWHIIQNASCHGLDFE